MKCRLNIVYFKILFATTFIFKLLFAGLSYGQQFTFKNDTKQNTIKFIKIKNLIVIPILINGKGPFNFLLDTGVEQLIITDTTLINSRKTENLSVVKIHGLGAGEEISAFYTTNIRVDIKNAFIKNIPTLILKEDVFNLSDYLGMKIHGILGYYFFNSFVVKINYLANKITFRIVDSKRKPIKGTKIEIELLAKKPYVSALLQTPELGSVSVKLIVDCGASHALSLETFKNGVFPVPTPKIEGNLGVGLSGKISGMVARVTNLKLGGFSFNNVLTNFPDFDDVAKKSMQKERNGNLGAELLKRFLVTFDYQNKAVYLKKNLHYKEPFEHDMSGIEVYAHSENFQRIFIARIENYSPAAELGLKINDEILSINFKPVNGLNLEEIVSLLKSGNGKSLIIEIVREQNSFIKVLTLKKRI